MFRFTIRDVLWLTVVVGLVVGWWIDRTSLAAELDSLYALLGGEKEAWQALIRPN